VPLRALVVIPEIQNLVETHHPNQRVVLPDYVFEVPCEVGLAIIDALLLSIPRHGAGKGKGKHQVNTRSRTRNWNTFHRQLSGLRPALALDSATRITHGPPPSAEWASLVAGLHPVSPGDFARSHGDGVCDQWPSPGVWLNRACRVNAGRAVVTPNSIMDPETWAAYVAHNVKCILMGSVFPAMACASQYMLRGFVNDEEKSMFWLAVAAATLDVDDSMSSTTQMARGRAVWCGPSRPMFFRTRHHNASRARISGSEAVCAC